MSNQVFEFCRRVTYAECTLGNHVYYSRCLEWLEAARGEFFRALAQPFLFWQEQETIFPVIECRVRYKAAARYDDELRIRLWLAQLDRVRLAFSYQVFGPGQKLLLECETFHVCTNLEEKPKRIPPQLADALKPYVADDPRIP